METYRVLRIEEQLDGCEELPQGFTGVESYPALAETMLRRGIPEDTVRDIFWNNAARLLD